MAEVGTTEWLDSLKGLVARATKHATRKWGAPTDENEFNAMVTAVSYVTLAIERDDPNFGYALKDILGRVKRIDTPEQLLAWQELNWFTYLHWAGLRWIEQNYDTYLRFQDYLAGNAGWPQGFNETVVGHTLQTTPIIRFYTPDMINALKARLVPHGCLLPLHRRKLQYQGEIQFVHMYPVEQNAIPVNTPPHPVPKAIVEGYRKMRQYNATKNYAHHECFYLNGEIGTAKHFGVAPDFAEVRTAVRWRFARMFRWNDGKMAGAVRPTITDNVGKLYASPAYLFDNEVWQVDGHFPVGRFEPQSMPWNRCYPGSYFTQWRPGKPFPPSSVSQQDEDDQDANEVSAERAAFANDLVAKAAVKFPDNPMAQQALMDLIDETL